MLAFLKSILKEKLATFNYKDLYVNIKTTFEFIKFGGLMKRKISSGIITLIISSMIILGFATLSFGAEVSYKLVWSDEFVGNELNLNNWEYNIGGNGWGNNEHQYYTDRKENVKVEDGKLKITAIAEDYVYGDKNQYKASYTSGRITTSGKQSFKYGKVEARIKLPADLGLWPAFWMLGQNEPKGWPYCGEIDILETWNKAQFAQGALHWEKEDTKPYKDNYVVGKITGIDKTGWHIYGIIWTPEKIQWTFDDEVFWEYSIKDAHQSELHKEFYIILNCAVGGNLPHFTPDENFTSAQVEVDYVRVYQRESDNPSMTSNWDSKDKNAVPKYKVVVKSQNKTLLSEEVLHRETVILPKITRKGYKFLGWYNGNKKNKDEFRIYSDMTIKAKWQKIKVKRAVITSKKQKYKGAATLRFKVKGKVDGYQIKVGKKKDTTKYKVITFGPFKSKKTYKAKVRAYVIDSRGKKIYGKWSKTVKITIK